MWPRERTNASRSEEWETERIYETYPFGLTCAGLTRAVCKNGQRPFYEQAKQHPSKILIYSASLPPGKAVELPKRKRSQSDRYFSDQIVSQWRNTILDRDYEEAVARFKNASNN